MMNRFVLVLFTLLYTPVAMAAEYSDWEVIRIQDEMTDDIHYVVASARAEGRGEAEIATIQCDKRAMFFVPTLVAQLESQMESEDGEIRVRFDDEAVERAWSTQGVVVRNGSVFITSSDFIARILNTERFRLETKGYVFDLNVTALSEELKRCGKQLR